MGKRVYLVSLIHLHSQNILTLISITLGNPNAQNAFMNGTVSADGTEFNFVLDYPMSYVPYAGAILAPAEMMGYGPTISATGGTMSTTGATSTTAMFSTGDSGKQQDYRLLGYGALIGIGFSVSFIIDFLQLEIFEIRNLRGG